MSIRQKRNLQLKYVDKAFQPSFDINVYGKSGKDAALILNQNNKLPETMEENDSSIARGANDSPLGSHKACSISS